jgi:hypothetical protein
VAGSRRPSNDPAPENGSSERGIPDGLLVGVLALLLGLTLLLWAATGLSGLFANGSWPENVHFTRTPPAMRHLLVNPHDLPTAWPDTPPEQLSGYGLFWGVFISELLVLFVLTTFAIGTLARWRMVRAGRRAAGAGKGPDASRSPDAGKTPGGAEAAGPDGDGFGARTAARAAEPHGPGAAGEGWATLGGRSAEPPSAPRTDLPVLSGPAAERAVPPWQPTPLVPVDSRLTRSRVLFGTSRAAAATRTVLDAPGPVLVTTSDPEVWSQTKDVRAKLGPTHLYDPSHLLDTPARLRWNPGSGCESRTTAAARAAALLAPVRPVHALDSAMAEGAETLLRCWLHAAAVDGRPFRQVHRWAQGGSAHEPVRILRTHPGAAGGSAGELESALTAHPERREMAQELVARALSVLSSVHIRNACTSVRADALALESFVAEGGTLYVVGEPIEDPRTRPGAMPLLTALVSSVVEHGRCMAARSSAGRLDPPLTLVLDDVAAVAPIPQLPGLLAAGDAQGLLTLALLRSEEQARARWPRHSLIG